MLLSSAKNELKLVLVLKKVKLDVKNYGNDEWPSWLKYYIHNRIVHGSNPTRCSARISDSTSLRTSG